MLVHRAQSAAATNISVTNTATNIFDLINTAGSTTLENAGFAPEVNGIDIVVEDGDIRYLDDGNTPTTTVGLKVDTGTVLHLRHCKLNALKLISVTGTVKCGIRIGECRPDECDSISNGSVTLEAGDIEIGAVEIKDGDSDTRMDVELDSAKNAAYVQSESLASAANQTTIITALTTPTDLEGGGKVSVGTTAVEATFTGTPKSIIITADSANTGLLYIGKSDVTNLGANAMAQLAAGSVMTMDYDDTSNAVWVVSDTATQNFFKGAII